MGAVEKEIEKAAQAALAALLDGEIVERDTAGAQGVRDFDLVDPLGEVHHSVEVTSVQLGSVRATRAGIERLREKDVGLTSSWSITVHERADLRPIERHAGPLLNQLQAAGVDRFGSHTPNDAAANTDIAKLAELGVVAGHRMPALAPARLHPGGYGSGSLDPMSVTEAVEKELSKSDNQRKLRQAPEGAERHLFVWLHDSHWYVASLLRGDFPLPPAPLLPDGVDVAWIAIGDGKPLSCTVLLRVDASGITPLDPATGEAAPWGVEDEYAPPAPAPGCSICGAPSRWLPRKRRRRKLGSARAEETYCWSAVCVSGQDHFELAGRPLSARELAAQSIAATEEAAD